LIEPRGCWFVEEPVIAASAHALCGCRPPVARAANRLDHQPAWFGVKFHFLRKGRFVEQRFRDADPSRIADPDDARLRSHRNYSVATTTARRKQLDCCTAPYENSALVAGIMGSRE
jgi:hypothetical protein